MGPVAHLTRETAMDDAALDDLWTRVGRNYRELNEKPPDPPKLVVVNYARGTATILRRASNGLWAEAHAGKMPVSVRSGPYGYYIRLGEAEEGSKPKRVSVPKASPFHLRRV